MGVAHGSHIINPIQLTNKVNDDVVEVGEGSDNRNNNYNDNNMNDIPPSDYKDRKQIYALREYSSNNKLQQ